MEGAPEAETLLFSSGDASLVEEIGSGASGSGSGAAASDVKNGAEVGKTADARNGLISVLESVGVIWADSGLAQQQITAKAVP